MHWPAASQVVRLVASSPLISAEEQADESVAVQESVSFAARVMTHCDEAKLSPRVISVVKVKSISREDKRKRIAQETMEIYAPLADRMGMHRIRDELEDLSFEILNIDARTLIQNRLKEIKKDKEDLFDNLSQEIKDLLLENNVKAIIYGREKTPFSIWRKLQKKRVSLEQITDIIGFRIILENIDDCYHALGVLHKKWNCIPGKFKDYISSPKINGYKSLHTSVIGQNRIALVSPHIF